MTAMPPKSPLIATGGDGFSPATVAKIAKRSVGVVKEVI
jgi:hypothetical protein